MSERIYKLQQQGGAYYIALPIFLITEDMLQHGVYVKVLYYTKNHIILRITAAKPAKEAEKQNEDS